MIIEKERKSNGQLRMLIYDNERADFSLEELAGTMSYCFLHRHVLVLFHFHSLLVIVLKSVS